LTPVLWLFSGAGEKHAKQLEDNKCAVTLVTSDKVHGRMRNSREVLNPWGGMGGEIDYFWACKEFF
jgi:hypothetical protein